jgi:hypothetical protein
LSRYVDDKMDDIRHLSLQLGKELGPVSQAWPHLTGDERRTFQESQDSLIRLRDLICAVETRLDAEYLEAREAG